MKKLACAVAAVLCACGGSDSNSSAVTIAGLYHVNESVTQSTCSTVAVGSTSTDTLTITTNGNTATMQVASLNGTCPGQISGGNQAIWSCTVTNSNGTYTVQASGTFTGTSVSGTATLGGSCQITFNF